MFNLLRLSIFKRGISCIFSREDKQNSRQKMKTESIPPRIWCPIQPLVIRNAALPLSALQTRLLSRDVDSADVCLRYFLFCSVKLAARSVTESRSLTSHSARRCSLNTTRFFLDKIGKIHKRLQMSQ